MAADDAVVKSPKLVDMAMRDAPRPPPVNPFTNLSRPLSPLDFLKLGLTSLTLLPVRLVLSVINLTAVAGLSTLATLGMSEEEVMAEEPLPWWRELLASPLWPMCRLQLALWGFHWVETEGEPAPRSEAPVMIANHTSFLDPTWFIGTHRIMPVSRAENARMPVVGPLLAVVRAIFVKRDGSPESRMRAKDAIISRARNHRLPRVVIFPEATCTNGKAVMSFKVGAFSSLLPVQPILITYPDQEVAGGYDPSWTYEQPLWYILVRCMMQVHSRLRVRYLPPISPDPPAPGDSEGSPAHVAAFARKAQLIMARELGVPTTEHSFHDIILSGTAVTRSRGGYPSAAAVPELKTIREVLDVDLKDATALLYAFIEADADKDGRLSAEEWVEFFTERRKRRSAPRAMLPADETKHREQLLLLFSMLDQTESGSLDFREFVLGLAILSGKARSDAGLEGTFRAVFRVLTGGGKDSRLGRDAFLGLARRAFPSSSEASAAAAFDAARGSADDVDEDSFVAYVSARGDLYHAYREELLGLKDFEDEADAKERERLARKAAREKRALEEERKVK